MAQTETPTQNETPNPAPTTPERIEEVLELTLDDLDHVRGGDDDAAPASLVINVSKFAY
jgi:hypothetical protein